MAPAFREDGGLNTHFSSAGHAGALGAIAGGALRRAWGIPLQADGEPFDELNAAPNGAGQTPFLPTPLPDKLAAAVDAGSLLSFVEGVSADERQDILDALQLASRGASAAHHRFNETEAWYGKYLEILEQLGWVNEQFAFTRYAQSEGELRMDQAALAIIANIATQNQLAALTEALDALKGLTQDDGTIRLFDFHSCAQTSGNFQLGAVQKSANGSLSMAVGAFHFQSDDQRRRFLFFNWGALAVQFWSAAQKMTFNLQHYAPLRPLVQHKLGATAQQYLADLPLA